MSLAREKREWARWKSGNWERRSGSDRVRNWGNWVSSCSTLCKVRLSDSIGDSGIVTLSNSLSFTILFLFLATILVRVKMDLDSLLLFYLFTIKNIYISGMREYEFGFYCNTKKISFFNLTSHKFIKIIFT